MTAGTHIEYVFQEIVYVSSKVYDTNLKLSPRQKTKFRHIGIGITKKYNGVHTDVVYTTIRQGVLAFHSPGLFLYNGMTVSGCSRYCHGQATVTYQQSIV